MRGWGGEGGDVLVGMSREQGGEERRLSAAHAVSGKASVGRVVGGCALRECTLKLGAFSCPAKVGESTMIQ